MCSKWDNDEVVQRLREYLKIPSVHPDIDYDDCVNFLKKQASLIGLPLRVHELIPKKPVLVMTWEGLQPSLPAILLNSHMDVVPVYEEHWSFPPFEAQISADGYIYARGVQDMKSIGMMHIEAVKRLKDAGVRLKRSVHISFVPDEEIGGMDGMKVFSESPQFRALNIGFALDESVPSQQERTIIAFNGERTLRQIKITCKGEPGHGSLLQRGTAGEKLHHVIDEFMKFRQRELQKLEQGVMLGDVTTVNLTMVEGGVQVNVLPESLSVYFDVRIAPDVDHDEFDSMVKRWCQEAGEGVSYEYLVKNPQVRNTKIGDENPFWSILNKTIKDMGFEVQCMTCPGATDARYVRAQGVPSISLSPLTNTPLLLHAHDERLHVDQYKKGIDIMEKVLRAVADLD